MIIAITAKKHFIIFALLAFLLNFFWESWHGAFLYEGHYGAGPGNLSSLGAFVQLMTYAALVDMILLLGVVSGGALVWRDRWWPGAGKYQYVYFVIAAVSIAVVVEVKAIYIFEQWAYSSFMPTVFGLGLSPLAQLAATGLAALGITRYLFTVSK